MNTLRQLQDVFGKQFWKRSVVVWTHSDTLQEPLETYLHGLDAGMRELVEASQASLQVNSTLAVASKEYYAQLGLLFQRVNTVAGLRPKPVGKLARRQRQTKFYTRAPQIQAEKRPKPLSVSGP